MLLYLKNAKLTFLECFFKAQTNVDQAAALVKTASTLSSSERTSSGKIDFIIDLVRMLDNPTEK